MAFSDKTYNLRIETDSGEYALSPADQGKMDADSGNATPLGGSFPLSDLKIEIASQSNGQVTVATSLRLPSRTLFARDHDRTWHPAWERCVKRLVERVGAYKERLSNKSTYAKEQQGTSHDVRPTMDPDLEVLNRAVADLDYTAFRNEMAVYEEALIGRVGRWVERYPAVERQLGKSLGISEIVEEVFLNAFESYDERPPSRMGQWIESLIDPSVQYLVQHRDEEKENVSFVQSANEAFERP